LRGKSRIAKFRWERPVNAEPRIHTPDSATLLEILRVQTEIAKLGLDLGGVMAFVAEHAQRMTSASGAVVELSEGEEMVYRSASGICAEQLGLRLKRSGSLSGLCIETSGILISTDTETDPRVDREACRRVGLRSMVVVPLKHGDAAVGVLKVASGDRSAFSDGDARVLELMADLIASSMFHAAKYGESELYRKATHDGLTNLPNRALFYDRLRQAMALSERSKEILGVLVIDMDGLKPVNDRFGHRAGDAAITEVAKRLKKASRKSDTMARVGGDEFAAVLPNVGTRESLAAQARRLADALLPAFRFEGNELKLGASVGGALYPEDAPEIGALYEAADKQMYDTKRRRKLAAINVVTGQTDRLVRRSRY
jgi:diguanylate cyclase (GGDEF)-like protein